MLASPGPSPAQPVFEHLPPRDTELPRNGGPAVTFSGESQDGLPVDAALAALVGSRLLRLLDALGLPLAAQVRLELGEDAQHVEERLASIANR